MVDQGVFDFRWLSPLGFSVALFLFYGGFYVFIGAFTPVMADSKIGRHVGIISARADKDLTGNNLTVLL